MAAAPLKKKQTSARAQGNMLTMVALCCGMALFACLVAFAFYMLMSQQKKGQTTADEASLSLARVLNDGDRIGQMNNVIERCRELVYTSRVNDDLAQDPKNTLWKDLSAQLLAESRENARLVEAERKNQIKVCVKNLQDIVWTRNKKAPTGKRFSLPWFESYFPQVSELKIGSIKAVESNVENLQVIPNLREFDLQSKYIQKGSNLYMGNINAKLPSPDNDLDFKLSSLPADVAGTVAPSRLTTSEVFQPSVSVWLKQKPEMQLPEHLPGATQIVEEMDVASRENTGTLRLNATATANGAMPCP
jgi:hypothetical protein